MTDQQEQKANRWMSTWAYRKATAAVASLINSPKRLLSLLDKAVQKSERQSQGVIAKSFESLKVMVRLLRAYAKGDYRTVAADKLVLIIAAIAYFVMPLDALPDFIAVFGLTDDAALLAWTLSAVKQEVERFLEWELQQSADLTAQPSAQSNNAKQLEFDGAKVEKLQD